MGDGEPLSSYLFKFEPKISGQDIVLWDNSAPCVQWRNVRDINNLAVAAMTFGDRVRTHRKALGMNSHCAGEIISYQWAADRAYRTNRDPAES